MSDFGGPKKGPKMGPPVRTMSQYRKSLFLGKWSIFTAFLGAKSVKMGHFGPFLAQKGVKKGSGDPGGVKNDIFGKNEKKGFFGPPSETPLLNSIRQLYGDGTQNGVQKGVKKGSQNGVPPVNPGTRGTPQNTQLEQRQNGPPDRGPRGPQKRHF